MRFSNHTYRGNALPFPPQCPLRPLGPDTGDNPLPWPRIIHGSSESGVQGQTFRPQPMVLWLQGTLASPTSAHSSSPGLATPLRLYVCDLQVCPFAANFHAQG